ncbi:hypothetical protein GGR57DRAFT_458209 [Xylariaceae sp. FL1272]|nr:hypothetical protein GGR57DRAFT_458209 [Xylariaceae sp. FL1272]
MINASLQIMVSIMILVANSVLITVCVRLPRVSTKRQPGIRSSGLQVVSSTDRYAIILFNSSFDSISSTFILLARLFDLIEAS